MWKCPHCNKKITYLEYNVFTSSREYGRASLIDDPTTEELKNKNNDLIAEWNINDTGDTEWSESPEYECPECNTYLDFEDLIWSSNKKTKTKKEKIPEEPEETKHNIIKPETEIIEEEDTNQDLSSILCKKCKHLIIANTTTGFQTPTNAELFICPECGTQNSIVEFKQLLDSNFFNTIIKKHATRRKTKSKSIISLEKSKSSIHT